MRRLCRGGTIDEFIEINDSPILLLGLGNILLSDEGVGVRAIERLQQRYALPPQVRVLDGGTLGMDLLAYLDGIEYLLVADAVQLSAPPGTLVRLAGAALPVFIAPQLSSHQSGLADLLWAAEAIGHLPSDMVLWGMQPASLDVGLELSPPIAAVLDTLVDQLATELMRWDVTLQPIS